MRRAPRFSAPSTMRSCASSPALRKLVARGPRPTRLRRTARPGAGAFARPCASVGHAAAASNERPNFREGKPMAMTDTTHRAITFRRSPGFTRASMRCAAAPARGSRPHPDAARLPEDVRHVRRHGPHRQRRAVRQARLSRPGCSGARWSAAPRLIGGVAAGDRAVHPAGGAVHRDLHDLRSIHVDSCRFTSLRPRASSGPAGWSIRS